MDVEDRRSDLVVVSVPVDVHQVQLVDETQFLESIECAIDRGAMDLRVLPASKLEHRFRVEVFLCLLEDIGQQAALLSDPETLGAHSLG